MNIGGLVVIALGVVIVIIALRGSQSSVFPGLFPAASSAASSTTSAVQNIKGNVQATKPNPDGSCPAGTSYVAATGMCMPAGISH